MRSVCEINERVHKSACGTVVRTTSRHKDGNGVGSDFITTFYQCRRMNQHVRSFGERMHGRVGFGICCWTHADIFFIAVCPAALPVPPPCGPVSRLYYLHIFFGYVPAMGIDRFAGTFFYFYFFFFPAPVSCALGRTLCVCFRPPQGNGRSVLLTPGCRT